MKNNKKYLITSAQAFAKPNKKFLEGLETYADNIGAQIIILPMTGSSAKEDWHFENMHKDLQYHTFQYKKQKLNSNLAIEQFHLRPQQVNPLTGLKRFTQRDTSLIFASPKQSLQYISDSNFKMPKAIMTTGVVTEPNYAKPNDSQVERRRLGNIAKRDHIFGAVYVEIENNKIFHFRNIRALKNGKFVDFGNAYDGTKRFDSDLEAMILGDIHHGYEDPKVVKANFQAIEEFKPKRLVLHDFFDGHSVSHYASKQLIYQWIREGADKGNLSLEKELTDCNKELNRYARAMNGGEVIVVASNHHEFLDRYLDEGRFVKDPGNARLAFELAEKYSNGLDPIAHGIEKFGGLEDNIRFLTRNEDYKINGWKLDSHGDKGPMNRSSPKNKEEDGTGKGFYAHGHSAYIFRNIFGVGAAMLNIYYTKGNPTDWTNTNGMLWDIGTPQLFNIINGRYKSK